MEETVYYLCRNSERQGFVFADELPEEQYSPGLFLIPNIDEKYQPKYGFDAIDNGKIITLDLVRSEDTSSENCYKVETKYGEFLFDLKDVDMRYIGNRVESFKDVMLALVVPRDEIKLEEVCRDFNFYFVGHTVRGN
jgi:hypothetical protein